MHEILHDFKKIADAHRMLSNAIDNLYEDLKQLNGGDADIPTAKLKSDLLGEDGKGFRHLGGGEK